jgi:hypothetical protein
MYYCHSLTFFPSAQLVLELLEVQELDLARGILRSTPAMLAMKQVTFVTTATSTAAC